VKVLSWFKSLDGKQRRAVLAAVGFVAATLAAAAVDIADTLAERASIQHTSAELAP
jgi:hypothetical protein